MREYEPLTKLMKGKMKKLPTLEQLKEMNNQNYSMKQKLKLADYTKAQPKKMFNKVKKGS